MTDGPMTAEERFAFSMFLAQCESMADLGAVQMDPHEVMALVRLARRGLDADESHAAYREVVGVLQDERETERVRIAYDAEATAACECGALAAPRHLHAGFCVVRCAR